MKKKNWVKKRHQIFHTILKPLVKLFLHIYFNIRLAKYKLKKGENILVLSNHQTDFDPIFISACYNKPFYMVATDSVFSNKVGSALLNYLFAPIPKKKGISDPSCIKTIMKVAKEKGNICIFIEGNRTFAEFQYHIDESVSKLIKVLKMPLVLMNISGGTGVSPRFANKKRRGLINVKTIKRLEYEEYKNYSDEKLLEIIKDNLKVYDSQSNKIFKSKKRAEYLERMLFVCPICKKTQTLYSKNEYLCCSSCNLKVEFTENLHLKSENENFEFNILNDWYQYQKKWCLNTSYMGDDLIFNDKEVKLFITQVNKPRKKIVKGTLKLTASELIFDDKIKFDIKDIVIASVLSGRKFNFSTDKENYLVIGNKRFNPLKYVLMFNKLPTHMNEKQLDKYFTLN